MSNSLAIATVTLALRNLIQSEVQKILGQARVTTVPPDRARDGNNEVDQINLFLYQTSPNPSMRNRGAQGRPPRAGEEMWLSPLALNLHYLITAYGADTQTANDHRLLGGAMKVLHDHPLLGADEIKAALPESGLHNQVERVRITLESPSTEEMSKLWSTFQSQYRISAAYQVAVVLIDSTRDPKAALPVLHRGSDGRGFPAVAAGFQSVSEATPPHPFPSARLGDVITIRGSNLGAANVVVRFSNRRLEKSIDRDPLGNRTERDLQVRLPDTAASAAAWPPGLYTVSLVVKPDNNLPGWTTNEVPFALATRLAVQPTTATAGDILTVTPKPHLRDSQREHAVLLLDDHQIPVRPAGAAGPPPQPTPPDLQFVVPPLKPGKYVVRMRVDGVDSIPFTEMGDPPTLDFDPAQKVTIT